MPKKKVEKNKKTIKKIIKFLEQIDWMFSLNNFEKNIEIKSELDKEKHRTCEFSYSERYQWLTLKIWPDFFPLNSKTQRKYLLHEFCHSITLPSKTMAYDMLDGKLATHDMIDAINERATSRIENILDGLLQNKLRYAKKAYKEYLKK